MLLCRRFTYPRLALLAVLVLSPLLAAAAERGPRDGPYLFQQEHAYEVKWVCDGEVRSASGLKRADLAGWQACGMSLPPIRAAHPPADAMLDGVTRFAAISDIHGQFDLMLRLLTINGILDENGNWAFGDGQLLIAGDIVDRGPAVTEALWFFYGLEQQAAHAGGGVQLVLGNHEVMLLRGDLRYLNEKYQQVEQLFDLPMNEIYAAGNVLGDWLRSRPIMMRINDNLLMHAGIQPWVVEAGISMEAINAALRSLLVSGKGRDERMDDDWLGGGGGPVWYRGYVEEDGITEAELDAQLAHFEVKRVIGGHNSHDRITPYFDGRVLQVDSRIKYGDSRGELLLWSEEKGFRRAGLDGVEKPL